MNKIMIVYGTRPEFIKLYPLIRSLKQLKHLQIQVLSTGQHSELLLEAQKEESFQPDIELGIIRRSGDLNELQALICQGLQRELERIERPDLVIVHGDTASAFSTALFAFQSNIPIAHVESGLRSTSLYSPFPEEFYRLSISKIASLNFAPTDLEMKNLLREGIDPKRLFVVGNTILDSVCSKKRERASVSNRVVITIHRRENRQVLQEILSCLNNLAFEKAESVFEYILHPSVKDLTDKADYLYLRFVEPMTHTDFLAYLNESRLIITDSGGVQEEAAILGINALIFRDKTERRDGLGKNIELLGKDIGHLERRVRQSLDTDFIKDELPRSVHESVSDKIVKIVDSFLAHKEVFVCLS